MFVSLYVFGNVSQSAKVDYNIKQSPQLIPSRDFVGEMILANATPRPRTSPDNDPANVFIALKKGTTKTCSDSIEAARGGRLPAAIGLLEGERQRLEQQKQDIPWMVHAILGSLKVREAVASKNQKKLGEQQLRESFIEAANHLDQARITVPSLAWLHIQYARACQNAGSKNANMADRQMIRTAHDVAFTLLEQDKKGGNLSRREAAQCHWILGISHSYGNGVTPCGDAPDELLANGNIRRLRPSDKNKEDSWKSFESFQLQNFREGRSAYERQGPLPDLFSDLDLGFEWAKGIEAFVDPPQQRP